MANPNLYTKGAWLFVVALAIGVCLGQFVWYSRWVKAWDERHKRDATMLGGFMISCPGLSDCLTKLQ